MTDEEIQREREEAERLIRDKQKLEEEQNYYGAVQYVLDQVIA